MNKLKNNSKPLIWLMGLLLAGLVAGCGSGGNGGSGGTASAQPGTVSVSLTDAPACGFDEVNVTVSKVRVHQSSSADDNAAGWTDITVDPQHNKINLLNLDNGALASLGETPLKAGHYTQLRLVLIENSKNPNSPPNNYNSYVVLSDTKDVKLLETPSAVQSGIKLIHQFTVNSGQRVDLLLDFDACKSIVTRSNGTYALKPVIKVIPFEQNGIVGFVDKTLPNVVVSAQDNNGEIERATVPNADGKFFLAHLPAGTDVKYNVVITADSHATAVISGAPVPSSTSITVISTNDTPTSPITLKTSPSQSINGTVTLDPADDDGTVIVAAKQTLVSVPPGTGPTVTVKSQVATVLSGSPTAGDYQYGLTLPLTLPIGAPSLGQYSTSLPIALSDTVPDQSAVAKIYTVQGSAQVVTTTGTTVYATQNPEPLAKDITIVANQTQDFTLTP